MEFMGIYQAANMLIAFSNGKLNPEPVGLLDLAISFRNVTDNG
jgi:hypothetical protein